jgi:hypothetical protein
LPLENRLAVLATFVLQRGFTTYPKPVAAPAAGILPWMVALLLRYSGKWGRTGNLD